MGIKVRNCRYGKLECPWIHRLVEDFLSGQDFLVRSLLELYTKTVPFKPDLQLFR